ncbi:MAG: hypothetical protein HY701_01355 [Gemmatimonadetes bacterium]|nr:hypothetical protein [Gemmatimonadota bacterium]
MGRLITLMAGAFRADTESWRLASSRATAQPITPAPMTTTSGRVME